jgi:methionyl aminopeptidase
VRRRRGNDVCWCGRPAKYKRCHGDRAALADRRPVGLGAAASSGVVPEAIPRPPYLASGGVPAPAGPQIVTGADLDRLRHAGRVAAVVLAEAGAAVAAGVTTAELDAIAHDAYVREGAYPSTLGYRGYRHSVCTSVNEVACHGIPDSRPMLDGDIVNIDVTAYVDGYHGDTSATYVVGAAPALLLDLVTTTEASLRAGIDAVRPGRPVRDIGRATQAVAAARGYGVVDLYGGHGIGTAFHAAPHIHHVDEPRATTVMVPGMAFTIEPMLTIGTIDLVPWADGWTEVTADGLPSAQFEHTVVVTDTGAELVTVAG